MALIIPEPRAQTHSEKPECFTCIMTWIALGLFAACAVACYWHAWHPDNVAPTNAPPIVPIDPPDDPSWTNGLFTNATPGITLNAVEQVGHLDARPYGWLDSSSNEVTDVYHLTIQRAPTPAGPWTNAYVVTLWESAYGDTMVVDGLWTNYTRRAPDGNVTNRAPLELRMDQPQQFYRAKP